MFDIRERGSGVHAGGLISQRLKRLLENWSGAEIHMESTRLRIGGGLRQRVYNFTHIPNEKWWNAIAGKIAGKLPMEAGFETTLV